MFNVGDRVKIAPALRTLRDEDTVLIVEHTTECGELTVRAEEPGSVAFSTTARMLVRA